MPKIGRTLSYINTERKGKSTEQSSVSQPLGSSRPGGTVSMPQGDYLLKSIWDKVFEIRTDSQGTEYIFGKLPMVTQYGITMYSGDGVDVPSLASGLPFDGRTIWYNPETNQIEVIGGTGGGSGEGVSNFWDLSDIPSWITNSKPKYTYSEIEGTPDLSGFATQNWIISQGYASAEELKKYIPISGYTEVSGEKNFTGGLKVNGSPIYYDTEKKYWKLEGDLLVTGGVTMYGNEGTYTPSTIMDALLYDDTTLGINSNGQLYVKGGTSGGGLDITALQNYLTQNSYLNVTGGDNRYLKLSGGTITGDVTLKAALYGESYISWKDPETTEGGYFYGTSFNASKNYTWTSSLLNWNVDTGVINFRKTPTVNGDSVWHSGNDGHNSGLDADTLDGYHVTHFMTYVKGSGYVQANLLNSELWNIAGGDGYIEYYDNGTWFNSRWGKVMAHYGFEGSLSGNASSATKLQTARTIWGQSFDGTGNASGVISGVDGISFNSYNAVSVDYNSNFVFKQPNTTALQDWSIQKQDTTKIFMVRNDGNVGIGTENPISKCDIYGLLTVRTESSTSQQSSLNLMNTSSDLWQLSARYGKTEGGHFNIYYYNGSTWAKPISINKNGNLLATGAMTFYSMRKLKNVVDERGLSLSELSTIKPTRYTWKDGRDNRLHFGGIADDIQQVLPEVVYSTSDGILTMDYGNAAFAVASSLIQPVVDHEKRIEMLEEENKQLRQEVERLKRA